MLMQNSEARLTSLLERSFAGDETAYREFLKLLSEVLRAYLRWQLYRLGRAEHYAEDLVQEALLAIHARWHTYERDIPITAWARAIARYKLIDFLRTSTREARHLSLDDIEETAIADGTAVDGALSLARLLATLPEKLRRSLELVRLHGFSVKEAAAVTGMSEAAIKINVHRGAKAIARELKK